MKRIIVVLFLVLAITGALLIVAFAHSGQTDSNGGHYNRSTGEYHYHHGYSAHSHYDMDGDGDIDCPYTFDDKTSHGGGFSHDRAETTKRPDLQDFFDNQTDTPTTERNSSKDSSKDVSGVISFLLFFLLTFMLNYAVAVFIVIGINAVYEKVTTNELTDKTQKTLALVLSICLSALVYHYLSQ